MSLYSVKEDLKQSLRSARRAILGRGGEISATAGFKDLPEAIYKIPADASLVYQTDDSVAYRKIVPSGAEEFAQVAKIGGMTYKTRNLIPFPYIVKSGTQNGTTYTFGDDGSITLDKTPTSGFMITFAEWKNGRVFNGTYTISTGVSLPTGTNLSLQGESGTLTLLSTGSSRTLNINGTYSFLKLWVSVDGTFSNVKLYPMLNEGDTALPYEPYFEGLRDTAVSELVSEGANIADINYNKAVWFFNSNNGTVISNTENSIEGQGFKGAEPYAPYASNGWLTMREASTRLKPFKKGDVFSVSFDFEIIELPSDYTNSTIRIGCGFYFKGTSGNLHKNFTINFASGVQRVSETFEIATEAEANAIPVMRIAFSSLHARVSNIMINYGEVSAPYKPYRAKAVDTFKIKPELIAYLEPLGYGRGVNAEYNNYIDFERKVFVPMVKEVDMGLLNWGYRLNNNRHIFNASLSAYGIQGQISPDIPINALAEDYRAVTVNATWVDRDMAYNSNTIGNQTIEIVDNRYTDEETFKKAVSGKKILFALETPIETDISAYLTDDNFIEVEGGGVIRAVNEYEFDAPSTINYIAKVGG